MVDLDTRLGLGFCTNTKLYVISPKNKTNFTADMLCLVNELILYCFVV